MHFATSIPWWLALLAVAGFTAFAVAVYRRPLVPLARWRRAVLMTLRALALAVVFALICRPVLVLPPSNTGDVIVPILIDTSRSMRIEDAGGGSRLSRAEEAAARLEAALASSATVERLVFSDQLTPAPPDGLRPEGRRTALQPVLDAAAVRYRDRPVAGIVLLSDGADSGERSATAAGAPPRTFTVGVGSIDGPPDREVTSIVAGDPRLDQAAGDLHVTIASRRLGREPFQVKVLADGQVIEARRVTPAGDSIVVDEHFTIFPDPLRASLYTAEVDAGEHETVLENNRRSLVVSPAGRRRRVLVLAGAPGYDYSFLMRALQQDPGLDVDAVVRKGRNETNADTFLVQAGGDRASALAAGFPASVEMLFGYDAVLISNLEGEFLGRRQLSQLAAFVGERGGGLLLTGGRTFERAGLAGTPLEPVLPVELTDRRGGSLAGAGVDEGPTGRQSLALTDDGVWHPVTRLGSQIEAKKLWSTLPPLASTAPLGGPRPGASVLAVSTAPNGALLPLVAVQKYGRGRSMTFAGEAAWRWRMMLPSADRRHDLFWRQAVRWLANDAPEPVSIALPDDVEAGDEFPVRIEIRDRMFVPVDGAEVEVRLTTPAGDVVPLSTRAAGLGQVSAVATARSAGLYRIQAEARRGGARLGGDDRWLAVGDNAGEFADPRLNEGVLQRIAKASGGRYVRADDAASLAADILRGAPSASAPRQRDLWHQPWTFALVVLLLSAEWALRRMWGLR